MRIPEIIDATPVLAHLRQAAETAVASRILSLHELLTKEVEPQPYRVCDMLPAEGLALLLGAEKTGKSLVGLQLALCVAAGEPFLGFPSRPCPVLFVDEEGSATTLQRRAENIAAALAIPDSSPLYFLHRSGWRLDDGNVIDRIEAILRELDAHLLVMGPLAQLADVEDENKARGINVVARNVLDLADRTASLIVLTHHRRKPDPKARGRLTVPRFFETSRGTNALTAAMDIGLGLDRAPDEDRGELLIMARDDSPQRIPIAFDRHALTFSRDLQPVRDRETADLDRLRDSLRSSGRLTAEQARELLGTSLNTAKARLRRLVEDDFAEEQPRARASTLWVLHSR